MFKLSYKILLLLTILASVAGLLTLIPLASASYPNVMGYKSLCTFAPAATFYCFLIAGTSCFIRSTLIKDQSGSGMKRLVKHIRSLIPLLIMLTAALLSTYLIVLEKEIYIDDVAGATIVSEKGADNG